MCDNQDYSQFMPPAQPRPFIDRVPEHILNGSSATVKAIEEGHVVVVDERDAEAQHSPRTYFSISFPNIAMSEAREILDWAQARHQSLTAYYDYPIEESDSASI